MIQRSERETSAFRSLSVRYGSGRLAIVFDGSYDASVSSMSGRTLAKFEGKGTSTLALDPNRFRSGVYLLALRTEDGIVSRPFIVDGTAR